MKYRITILYRKYISHIADQIKKNNEMIFFDFFFDRLRHEYFKV